MNRKDEIIQQIEECKKAFSFNPNKKQEKHIINFLMDNEELDVKNEVRDIFRLFSAR